MQFENFDNKLKQAADQHHPNYDERAWTGMEKLLDQHLPLKNERKRRFIFFLLLFLLVGGGAWIILSKPWQESNRIVSVPDEKGKTPATSAGKQPDPTRDIPTDRDANSATTGKNPNSSNQQNEVKSLTGDQIIHGKADLTISDKPGTPTVNTGSKRSETEEGNKNITAYKRNNHPYKKGENGDRTLTKKSTEPVHQPFNRDDAAKTSKDNVVANNSNIAVPPVTNNNTIAKADDVKTQVNQPATDTETASKTEGEKKENITTQQPATKQEARKNKPGGKSKSNYFSFSFSVAPDLSYVSFDEPGEVRLLTGAGFGYTFKNRWTIRTGFYTGHKVYTADKYDYKPDGGIPNPTYLAEIDADCKVYEVPLSLAYNFSRSEKHSLFASAGLSSLFMKKEEYQYLYKYPGPPPSSYTHTKTISNQNKHYFSVLTLSAGYGRSINKTFSISAEPYFKMPLGGVGYGNVKLNSIGVLFSVNARPFR